MGGGIGEPGDKYNGGDDKERGKKGEIGRKYRDFREEIDRRDGKVGRYGRFGRFGRFGRYGIYGIYGRYGRQWSGEQKGIKFSYSLNYPSSFCLSSISLQPPFPPPPPPHPSSPSLTPLFVVIYIGVWINGFKALSYAPSIIGATRGIQNLHKKGEAVNSLI